MKVVKQIPKIDNGAAGRSPYAALHRKIWDGQIWELEPDDLPGHVRLRQSYVTLINYARYHGYDVTIRKIADKIYVQRHDA